MKFFNKRNFSHLFILFFLTVLLKGVIWSIFIPAWHFPDEPQHFAHVACNAETNQGCSKESPSVSGNLNREIYTALELLDVDRDNNGNNKFTYHPEYNISYSENYIGIYEKEIADLPVQSRQEFVKEDMAQYPELFYDISKIPYSLVYFSNVFTRLFFIRIFWLFSFLVITWCTYKIARFIGSEKFAVTCAILVSFQPMFTFVSSGVTSDNLLNLLFSLVILECVFLLGKGWNWVNIILLFSFTYLGLIAKPQFFIAFGLIVPVVFYTMLIKIRKSKQSKSRYLWLTAVILALTCLIFFYIFKAGSYLYVFTDSVNSGYSVFAHLRWTLIHTYREVIPWYWGVFRWLSLTLPSWINGLLMRLLLVSIIGLFIQIGKIVKRKDIKKNIIFFFLIYSSGLYFLSLFFWDWDFTRSHGFSFGIQGRYYFPVIIPCMILFFSGLKSFWDAILYLLNRIHKLNKKIIFILDSLFYFLTCLFFITINIIAFFWLVSSYYDTVDLNVFLIQASQYKPWFAKGGYLFVSIFAYIIVLLVFIKCLIISFLTKNDKKTLT